MQLYADAMSRSLFVLAARSIDPAFHVSHAPRDSRENEHESDLSHKNERAHATRLANESAAREWVLKYTYRRKHVPQNLLG